jgi:SAM-dependent methyltransferase
MTGTVPPSPSEGGPRPAWDGPAYQERFDRLAATGADVHGEADFVAALDPRSVLDAGCGTGRVARELARRGIDVVGVDPEPSMIDTARQAAPALTWVVADMAAVELGRAFDVVVMAGNVPLFTAPGTQAALVAGCRRHLSGDGALVAGFQLGRGYTVEEYDDHCRRVGLERAERFATWAGDRFGPESAYQVSVHRPG